MHPAQVTCVCVCVCASMQGFDEFMNLVMDDAEEVYVKEKKRRSVGELSMSLALLAGWVYFTMTSFPSSGRILLRGDNITLIMQAK